MEMSEGKPCGKAAVESAADARGLFIHIVLSAIVKIVINHCFVNYHYVHDHQGRLWKLSKLSRQAEVWRERGAEAGLPAESLPM